MRSDDGRCRISFRNLITGEPRGDRSHRDKYQLKLENSVKVNDPRLPIKVPDQLSKLTTEYNENFSPGSEEVFDPRGTGRFSTFQTNLHAVEISR
jgi:hypothetical protein